MYKYWPCKIIEHKHRTKLSLWLCEVLQVTKHLGEPEQELWDNTQVRLKIGLNGKPFIPEQLGGVGTNYGMVDVTKFEDGIRNMRMSSRVSFVDYVYKRRHHKLYFRHGKWMRDIYGFPMFHVWDLLEYKPGEDT